MLKLESLGDRVRKRREALGLTQRQLAVRSELSLRFLAQLEAGQGNISLMRFAQLARALGLSASALLGEAGGDSGGADDLVRGPLLALVGLRGAGKSTIGRRLARQLRVPLVELDARIEQAAGLPLSQIFELHGEAYYRRLERETLRRVFDETPAAV